MKDHVTINDNRNVFLDAINIATHALKPIVYTCRKNFNNPGGQCYSWLNIDCWWFLWQQCMFTLIGRIADHSHKSLISREFQWNSRLAWWQAQTSKLTADRPRRVYFLFTCTRRRNPAHRRRPSGMHFPNDSEDSDEIGDCPGRCFNYCMFICTCCKNPRFIRDRKNPWFLRFLRQVRTRL